MLARLTENRPNALDRGQVCAIILFYYYMLRHIVVFGLDDRVFYVIMRLCPNLMNDVVAAAAASTVQVEW